MYKPVRLFIVVFAICAIAAISCKEKDPTSDPTEKLNFFFSCDHNALQVAFTAMINHGDVFLWDFGDGNTDNERNPVHIYTKGGTYNVKLTVTGKGESKEFTKQVVLGLSFYKLDFSFAANQNNLQVVYTPKIDYEVDYLWDFGDGNTSKEKNPVYTYANGGTYSVKLTVAANGETKEITKQVAMGLSSFKLDFSFSADHDAMQIDFLFNVDYDVVVLWDFGDGSTSTGKNPAHIYAAEGVYDVILTVSAKGETKEITKKVRLGFSNIELDFAFIIDYDALKVTFTARFDFVEADYLWNFGDGKTSDEKNPVHVYAKEGSYDVKLTVSAKGEMKETTKKVTLTR
jgi:PKD repeat protein